MSTYTSSNRQRKQTIIQGKVESPERYDKFYDLTFDALSKGQYPLVRTMPGQAFVRVATRDINQSRTIPPLAYSANSLSNRFSGMRLDGKPGQGALYMASLPGLLREFTHYQLKDERQKRGEENKLVLPGAKNETSDFMDGQLSGSANGVSQFHLYRAAYAYTFADARISSASVQEFFKQTAGSAVLREKYGLNKTVTGERLVQSTLESEDFSSARGIADAVFDFATLRGAGIVGVQADSARSDSDWGLVYRGAGGQVGGPNYIFFGRPDTQISSLQPVQSFSSFKALKEFTTSKA